MSTVSISNVKKAYGLVEVIHGINAEIEAGEFVILVGPSGCGKSTLLRMVAGLEEISGGTISIGDRVVNDVAPKDRDIAMVFQNYALYPQMTVAQNMGFALEMAGETKETIKIKVADAAAILGLEPLLGRKPASLSGGQRQRVAMGRAIVRAPQVFLFDEPLSNLDAKLRVQMRTEIKALHARLGTTILYVTHDQVEAMTMADKIVVMNSGRIEQIGAPLELYDNPANIFVAGFLGSPSMNFFDAVSSEAGLTLANGDVVAISNSVAKGASVVLGARPEHIHIDPNGPVQAVVNVVEPTGADTFLMVEVGEKEATLVINGRVDVKRGDTLRLSIDPEHALLFDAATGAALPK